MFIVFPRLRLRISAFALPLFLVMLRLEGVIPFFIIFFSAAAHEFGHLTALRLCGYRLRRMDILPMGALIVCPEGINHRHEALIALSGPAVSLALASCASLCFVVTGAAEMLFAAVVNFVLGLFNLMPIRKLDGGKALFCILSHKKTEATEQICSAASLASKILFFVFVTVCITASGFNLGVIVLSVSLLIQLYT